MLSSGHHTLSGLLIVTRAIFTGLGLTLAPGDLRRVLIGAKAQERGLAELSIRRPLGICELRDELRPDPGRVAYAWRRIERWTVGSKAVQLRGEHVQRLLREAGADLADKAQPRSVVEPDEESAKMLRAALGRGESADHELGLLSHLDLAPVARPRAWLVRRSLVLRDDAFPTEALGLAVCGLPTSDEPAGNEERVGPQADETLELGAALAERAPHEPSALELEQVEHRVSRGRRPGSTAPLQQLEARDSFRVKRHELTVEQKVPAGQCGHRQGDVGEPGGQVMQHPRPHLHAAAFAAGECADAVVLFLEDPFRPLHDAGRQRREHWADEFHFGPCPTRGPYLPLGSPVAAFATSPPSSRAIHARSRRVRTERGFARVTSTVEACRSLRFMRSHCRPLVWTRTHPPLSFLPFSANTMLPLRSASSKLSSPSSSYVPMSQTMTVPPPYSPSGITPSKRA